MFGLAFAAFAALLIWTLLDRGAALDRAAHGEPHHHHHHRREEG